MTESMKLEHFTDQVFKFEHDRSYVQKPPMGFMKPEGLWVSVAGEDSWDWPAWCRSESFCLSSLDHVAEVNLVDDANILHVDTPEGLDLFHHAYAVDDELLRTGVPSRRLWATDEKRYWSLDWPTVAAKYDGVIIAPYHYSRRLDGPMWYYGWDCASGVIWNLDAVASVEVIR